MPQSDGRNRLQRFEFKVGDRSYKFKLNPEEYSQDEPSRSTVTQTKGGAWIDDFGGGLEIIFMRGSTGMRNGFQRFVDLRNTIRYYRDNTNPGNTPSEELIFHNFTDGESWVVHLDPAGFKLFRSKANPLMYMYEIRLVCLRKASQPKREQRTEVIVDRDEFQKRAEMKIARENIGEGESPRVNASPTGLPTIPNRLADSNTRIPGEGYIREHSSMSTHRMNLQFFAEPDEVYNAIKPELDLRLSPLGSHYQTHIRNNTYTPSGEFKKNTLGNYIFNHVFNYDIWNKYKDEFSYVMLDLYAMTDAFYNNYELFKSRFSRVDVERLISNIRWLVGELEKQDVIPDPELTGLLHNVTNAFRQVELVLSRMRKDPNLFDRDITGDLNTLERARGGDN